MIETASMRAGQLHERVWKSAKISITEGKIEFVSQQ